MRKLLYAASSLLQAAAIAQTSTITTNAPATIYAESGYGWIMWTSLIPSSDYTPITNDFHFKLVFDDEFNTLDITNNWFPPPNGQFDTTYAHDCCSFRYSAANLTVSNGCLAMKVTQTGPKSYSTAALTSRRVLAQPGQSVYWEARLRMATGDAYGIANGFWTDTEPNWKFPEIDFSEWWGTFPTVTGMHLYDPDGNVIGTSRNYYSLQMQGQWHVYGTFFNAAARQVTYYIDGNQVQQLPFPDTMTDSNWWSALLIATSSGTSAGDVNQNGHVTTLPSTFLVDYVHVYSNAAGQPAVIPQTNYKGPGDAIGSTSCTN